MTSEPMTAVVPAAEQRDCAKILPFPKLKRTGHARTSSGRAGVIPKTAGSAVLPSARSASEKSIALPEAIRPRAFQLLTADAPTPPIRAASASPPTASMTASTVVSMDSDYSRFVNKSILHTLAIVTNCELRPNMVMGRTHQDVANRLLLLERLIGLKAADICRKAKIAPNAWSQYTDPEGKRRITLGAAYKLKDAYGVTLEWIYDDDDTRLPQDIAAALREVRKVA
jgi:hypothetical protein